jgi:V8-like Glu-specific endopeptidase
MIFHFLLLRTDQQKVHDCENQNKRHKLCDGFHENRPFSGCNTARLQILAEPMACKRPAQDTKGRIRQGTHAILRPPQLGRRTSHDFYGPWKEFAKQGLAQQARTRHCTAMSVRLLFPVMRSILVAGLLCWLTAGSAMVQESTSVAPSSLAAPLPVLDVQTRKAWVAVGALMGGNGPVIPSCTGTLVAPDLVLTAAHCVGTDARQGINRWFVAGWDNPRMVMRVRSAEIKVHPKYKSASKDDKLRYDVATIRLERPVPSRLVTPIAIRPYSELLPGPFAIVGYHRRRPSAVNGRFDCARIYPPHVPVLQLDCHVISGNSGSPVMVQEDGQWKSVAVLVATLGKEGAAAVPHDTWVLLEWTAALERAKAWK